MVQITLCGDERKEWYLPTNGRKALTFFKQLESFPGLSRGDSSFNCIESVLIIYRFLAMGGLQYHRVLGLMVE